MKLGKLLKIVVLPTAVGLVVWLEKRRPLRCSVESKTVRTTRNLLMMGTASAAFALVEQPLINRLTRFVEKKNFGLLKIFKLPTKIEMVLAIILLDYTLYLWHFLAHKSPFLWRFHLVHHIDLDLDSTTAYRFHFGEILLSVFWRTMQILLIGASPSAVKLWQALMFPAVVFHHSNFKLPPGLDENLSLIFVTPKLHGIHHSAVQTETNSNWSTIFSIWDRLHRTLKTGIDQDKIVIGVPAYQNSSDVCLKELLILPFTEQKSDWQISAGNENG